ncbi:hypothetical protein M2163_006939 [Streptomyces sp. SAI-135]|uniref:hypothetical protein n=1 Tax=unclassified Streptomyces TaxID=2593676 RepID=UPI0024772B2B|nr:MULTISPECIES: hypothetical protein [unclassified Streptomyces]MDH6516082.1 hypothetical protein [Streptomyces sp. SAI-090]MDH6619831.1 hypothetical protein [Streptomyces sp. SAI-135]
MNHSSQERSSQAQRPGQPQYPPQRPGPYEHAHNPVETVIEVPNKRLHRYDKVEPGEQTVTIRRAGPGTNGEPLAYVHVPRDAPKGGRRARPSFTVTAPNGQPLSSVRSAGSGVYEVYGGDGAPIGRITRRGGRTLPWPRRVHWSVQPAQGGEPLAGEVGTRKAWTVFVLISPLYFVCWAVMAAQGAIWLLLGEKGEAKKEAAWEMEPPTWTRWRQAGAAEAAIEYQTGRKYRLASPRLDPRLAYAQAVLHVWDRR